jgi:hypothetical protein
MERDNCKLYDRLRVISGTAAGSQAWKQAFEQSASSYNTTVHTIDDELKILQDYRINVLKEDNVKIALLTESETGFGWHFDDPETSGALRTVYRYPREISRLRSAYGEQELKAVVGAQQQTPSFRKLLGFRMFDIGPSTDSSPIMATNQTPLSQDALLEGIVRSMQHDHIKLAGIVATDVFDALFIARYLRDACPDIRLFTFDSDLLYVKAAEDFPFDGILALSTYPLNQDWTGLQHMGIDAYGNADTIEDRLLFPSRGAEGIYNAMRVLLVRSGYVPERAEEEQLADYFDPTNCKLAENAKAPTHESILEQPGCLAPPVWLTAVTRSGYWPLAVITSDESLRHTELLLPGTPDFKDSPQNGLMVSWPSLDNKSNFRLDHPPRLWKRLFELMAFLMSWYFICHFIACASSLGERQGYAHLNLWPDEEGWLARLCYLLVCSFSLLAVYAIYVLPLVAISRYPGSDGLRPSESLAKVFFGMFLALTCSPWLRFRNRSFRPRVTRAAWPDTWHYGILALSALFAAFFAVKLVWLFPFQRSPDQAAFFMAYRSINFESGVSPILPLLALLFAFFCWGRVHLKRLTMRFERLDKLPALGIGAEFDALTRCQAQMEQLVNEPLPLPWRTFGSFALAAGIVVYLAGALKTFEPANFDLLVLLLLAILYALLFLTWTRFLLVWNKFQGFLEELNRHPIRFVFSRLPRARLISPLLQLSARRRYSALVDFRDRLRMLANDPFDGLAAAPVIFETQLGEVLASALDGKTVRQTQAMLLLDSIDRINRTLVDGLNRGYWREGHCERRTGDKDAVAADSSPTRDALGEEIIAVQYRDYIQYVLRQQRNLLVFVIAGFLLSMLALHCYPFQSPRIITTFITIMFLMFGAGVITVLAKADRDPVLSRIAKTSGGKLSGSFFVKVAGYLGVPLITVLGSQFPSWGKFLFSWIGPVLEALK